MFWKVVVLPALLGVLAAGGVVAWKYLPRPRPDPLPVAEAVAQRVEEPARPVEPVKAPIPAPPRPPEPPPVRKGPGQLLPPGQFATEVPAPPKPAETRPAPTPAPAQPPTPPAQPPAEPAPRGPLVLTRIDNLDEEQLRRQLRLFPEVSLDTVPGSSQGLLQAAQRLRSAGGVYPGPVLVLGRRPDLAGLPLLMGDDCHLGRDAAQELQALSRRLRVHLEACTPAGSGDPRPDADRLREVLVSDTGAPLPRLRGAGRTGDRPEWLRPQAVPALMQLLMAEGTEVRKTLVDLLGRIDGPRATQALAMRALVDLSPDVRAQAVRLLRDRPREDCRPLLLAGLRYPWAPVTAHAAEALTALEDTEAIPQLVSLLDQPNPALPVVHKQGSQQVTLVRELVRVNHLANCVMCHDPSFDRSDLVRGAVPTPGQALPAAATTPMYYERGGTFVRADVTYLRQDFSVVQPVDNPGPWPTHQRFDYLLRTRRPTPEELQRFVRTRDKIPDLSRESVLHALRRLTKQDLGRTRKDWEPLLRVAQPGQPGPQRTAPDGPDRVGEDWRQFLPGDRVVPAQPLDLDRLVENLLRAAPPQREELLQRYLKAKEPEYTEALSRAVPRLQGPALDRVREVLAHRLARLRDPLLRERLTDPDTPLREAAARACGLRGARALVPDLLRALSDPEPAVVQAAREALRTLTGQDHGPERTASAAERGRAAEAWNAWWNQRTGLNRTRPDR